MQSPQAPSAALSARSDLPSSPAKSETGSLDSVVSGRSGVGGEGDASSQLAGREGALMAMLQARGPVGLKWVEVSESDVDAGHEVENAALIAALHCRAEFTELELQQFGVAATLSIESFAR